MSRICQYLCAIQLSISVVHGSFSSDIAWITIESKRSLFKVQSAGFVQICRPSVGNYYHSHDRMEARCISARPRAMWREKNPAPRTILSTASQPPESTEIDERATIFVGNLPWALDSYGLRKLFEPYGKIRIAQISWDDRTDRSRSEHSVRRTRSRHPNATPPLTPTPQIPRFLFFHPCNPIPHQTSLPVCDCRRGRPEAGRGRHGVASPHGAVRWAAWGVRGGGRAGGTASCPSRTPPPPPPPPPP